jgi:hypothetical protein
VYLHAAAVLLRNNSLNDHLIIFCQFYISTRPAEKHLFKDFANTSSWIILTLMNVLRDHLKALLRVVLTVSALSCRC